MNSFVISKSFDQFQLDININIGNAKKIGFFGDTGSGKSTILNILSGFISSEFSNINYQKSDNIIGYVDQDSTLIPHMTILDHIHFFENNEILIEYRNKLLQKFNIDNLLKSVPKELSGGQQQSVSILLALLRNPDILLLDEPFSNMDKSLKLIFIEEIKKYISNNKMLFLVSHDITDLYNLVDIIVYLKDGKVISIDSIHEQNIKESESSELNFIGEILYCDDQVIKLSYLNQIFVINNDTKSDFKIGQKVEINQKLVSKNIKLLL